MAQVYVVVEFGCNSSYNDMYPPSSRVFGDKETAYAYYQSKKDELGKHYDPKIEVKHYSTKNGGETAIEGGGNEGAKRPCGVSIMCCTVE